MRNKQWPKKLKALSEAGPASIKILWSFWNNSKPFLKNPDKEVKKTLRKQIIVRIAHGLSNKLSMIDFWLVPENSSPIMKVSSQR